MLEIRYAKNIYGPGKGGGQGQGPRAQGHGPMPMCPGAKALPHDYFDIWAHTVRMFSISDFERI